MTDYLNESERAILLDIARQSIQHGLQHGRALKVNVSDYPDTLQVQRASFITLHRHERLRGCIGALQASMPLVQDVAEHAYSSAFEDPRFPRLTADEFADLTIHIAILSLPELMTVKSEADLLTQLRPGIDGLILRYQQHRGTFLPAVWDSLPNAVDFLAQLKQKAGLEKDFWSDDIQFERYTTESFP